MVMRLIVPGVLVGLLLWPGLACQTSSGSERNPFTTLVEVFGASSSTEDEDQTGAPAGAAADTGFRETMTVTFANDNAEAELNVSFAAWVSVSSIRTAEQQDALLAGGYVQLTSEVQLGTAFALPPGTFVYSGPGVAGATPVRLLAAQEDGDGQPAVATFDIITPDVILAFSQPPVSCDSVAFFYTVDGEIPRTPVGGGMDEFGSATGSGPLKTLAQIDVYECEPFQPGVFLRLGGGARMPNEFFEGDDVRFDFFAGPDQNGDFANVTIG
jgi:hypothetical protein